MTRDSSIKKRYGSSTTFTFKRSFSATGREAATGASASSAPNVRRVVTHGRDTEEEAPRAAKKAIWKDVTESRPLGTFKVASYNVMADAYTEPGPGRVTVIKPFVQGRLGLILKDIENIGADVLCLQEVESDLGENDYRQFLNARGYDMVYHVKARAKDHLVPENWKGRVDGLLLAWRTKKFNLLKMDNFELRELIFESPNKWGVERKTLQSLLKLDNSISIAILETTHVRAQRKQIAIANIHGHAGGENAKACINVLQTQLALHACRKAMYSFLGNNPRKVDAEAPAPLPLIFAGDFNARPGSGSHSLLSTGFLPKDSHFLTYSQGKQSTTEDMKHYMSLKSSYGDSLFGEPRATYHANPQLNGVLDYIWYTPSHLSVHRLLEVPDLSMRSGLKLPTTEFPSDHLPIAAEFSFNPSTVSEDSMSTESVPEPVTYVRSELRDRDRYDAPNRIIPKPAPTQTDDLDGFDEDSTNQIQKTPSKKTKGRPRKYSK